MKLYATTTSERASKSQGGNNFIETQITIDKIQACIVNVDNVAKVEKPMLTIVIDERQFKEVKIVERNGTGFSCGSTKEVKGNKQKDEKKTACKHCGNELITNSYTALLPEVCRFCHKNPAQ